MIRHRHEAAPSAPARAARARRRRRCCPPAARRAWTSPSSSASVQNGAQLFAERCSGCHTLDVAGAQGSADEGPRPRARRRPELQQAQGLYEDVALRDPQRRLLRRDHAAEHRRRQAGARRRRVRRRVRGQAGRRPRVARAARPSRARRCRRRPAADAPPSGAVLDLKLHPRATRTPVRAALARRGDDGRPRPRARARRAPARAPARARGAARASRTPPTTRSPRPSARARTPTTRSPRMREVAGRGEGARRGAARRSRPSCRTRSRALPNLPDPTARRRGHGRCARSASRADARRAARPPRARRRA